MNITLTPELEKIVQEKVRRGDYDTTDALIQEAVHRLIEEDESDLDALPATLHARDAEIDRGESSEFDEHTAKDLAKDIHERGLKRLAELQKQPQGRLGRKTWTREDLHER